MAKQDVPQSGKDFWLREFQRVDSDNRELRRKLGIAEAGKPITLWKWKSVGLSDFWKCCKCGGEAVYAVCNDVTLIVSRTKTVCSCEHHIAEAYQECWALCDKLSPQKTE